MALVALPQQDADSFYKAKVETARFYVKRLLPRYIGLTATVKGGSDSLYGLEDSMFETA
jgi:hypothetical protein